MNIQDLGSLGELIGGIAVVASVIYLTIQIRQGITGYRSNTLLQSTHHFSNLQMEVASNDALLKSWAKAERGEPLDPLEQRRVLNVVSSYLIGFENMFHQCEQKMMDWEGYKARRIILASFMSYTGVWSWWSNFGRNQFPASFVADVDQSILDFKVRLPAIEART